MVEIKEPVTETSQKPEGNMVEKATAAAERLEKANADMLKLVERQEALAAHNLISGDSRAGTPPPEKKEESPQEYAKRVMGGEV